jgi:hypothetical protein
MPRNDYEAIQEQIRRAQIQRSVYLAELIAEHLAATWNGTKALVANVAAAAQSKRRWANVFTFDA